MCHAANTQNPINTWDSYSVTALCWLQGSWITGVRSLKSKSSIRRCLERCPSERDLSSLDETYEEIKVSVVNNAIEFMKLLNEFGTHVEIQSHLDLRGLTNTAFDDTRTLNGRFSFRSLKVCLLCTSLQAVERSLACQVLFILEKIGSMPESGQQGHVSTYLHSAMSMCLKQQIPGASTSSMKHHCCVLQLNNNMAVGKLFRASANTSGEGWTRATGGEAESMSRHPRRQRK